MFDDTTPETDESGFVRAKYNPDGTESLSVTIAEAVARSKGAPIDDLGVRLFETLDPDAIDRLFAPTDTATPEAEIRFVAAGRTVVVRNTGDVFVRPLD